MASKIIHLAISEEEVQALDNLSNSLHVLGFDGIDDSGLVVKVCDKISDAYYNG